MISIYALFWLLIIFFALIGATRGRTKEFIVALSAVVGIFLNMLLETYMPFYKDLMATAYPTTLFLVRSAVMIVVVILGYITPNIPQIIIRSDELRPISKMRNFIWGLAFGALNGYLIVGSIWFFLDAAHYPFAFMLPPDPAFPAGTAALNMVSKLPPSILTPPGIYFALVIAFVIVLGAFI